MVCRHRAGLLVIVRIQKFRSDLPETKGLFINLKPQAIVDVLGCILGALILRRVVLTEPYIRSYWLQEISRTLGSLKMIGLDVGKRSSNRLRHCKLDLCTTVLETCSTGMLQPHVGNRVQSEPEHHG